MLCHCASHQPTVVGIYICHVASCCPPAPRLGDADGWTGVAGMTSTAMSLLYRLDATIMNLIWNLERLHRLSSLRLSLDGVS